MAMDTAMLAFLNVKVSFAGDWIFIFLNARANIQPLWMSNFT